MQLFHKINWNSIEFLPLGDSMPYKADRASSERLAKKLGLSLEEFVERMCKHLTTRLPEAPSKTKITPFTMNDVSFSVELSWQFRRYLFLKF